MSEVQQDKQKYTLLDSEIELSDALKTIWHEKFKILIVILFSSLIGILISFSLPDKYTSNVILAPVQQEKDGLFGSLQQLGGLASFAGVDISGPEVTDSKIAQEVMQSWAFIDRFIKDNQLEVPVYAINGWIKSNDSFTYDGSYYDEKNQAWLVEDDTGQVGPPSSWELFETFRDMLSITQDEETGLISISLEYYSPNVAKDWLDLYVAAINQFMQKRKVTEVSNNIEYLQTQLNSTSMAEMREVLYAIIGEQIKNKMLAEASPDFTFMVVSPSMVPEEKSEPQRILIILLVVLISLVIAIAYFVLNAIIEESN